ncbi:MAG: alpha/beta hydrolase [Symploca sp. SIO2E6]|nr:alpha/beta hydrolase [Symploca sp. SIO2E6]
MSNLPKVLWLTTSPSFSRFEQPLIRYLSNQISIAQWEYLQSQDEAASLDAALVLLHDCLKSHNQPIHLIGHSTSGLLGLLYTRKYPERVKSLTLLGVGAYPYVDWQAHYYSVLQLLNCSRQIVLAQMVSNIFGYQDNYNTKKLIQILERDLITSVSPHSLLKRVSSIPGGVEVPLLVCGGQNDVIIDPNALKGWFKWLKEGDVLWECPQGPHFFHYFHPQQVGRKIIKFWQALPVREANTLEKHEAGGRRQEAGGKRI